MIRLPPAKVLIWRYVTGSTFDGRERTNAGWTTYGTSPSHRCTWWSRKPRLHRALWRDVPPVGLIGELVCWHTDHVLWGAANGYLLCMAVTNVRRTLRSAETVAKTTNTRPATRSEPSASKPASATSKPTGTIRKPKTADTAREIIDEIAVEPIEELELDAEIKTFKRKAT